MGKTNLIFIPGWNMRGEVFQPFAGELEQKFTCHFFTPLFSNYEAVLQQLFDYISENKLENLQLLGWSMGGQLAMLAAEKIQVDRIILLDSAAIFSRKIEEKRSFYELCQKDFERAVKYFHKLMGSLSLADSIFIKNNFINDKQQALGLLRELHEQDLSKVVKNINCQIDIIHSKNDRIISFSEAAYLKKLKPKAEICVLKSDFHFPFLDHCAKITRTILESGQRNEGVW